MGVQKVGKSEERGMIPGAEDMMSTYGSEERTVSPAEGWRSSVQLADFLLLSPRLLHTDTNWHAGIARCAAR